MYNSEKKFTSFLGIYILRAWLFPYIKYSIFCIVHSSPLFELVNLDQTILAKNSNKNNFYSCTWACILYSELVSLKRKLNFKQFLCLSNFVSDKYEWISSERCFFFISWSTCLLYYFLLLILDSFWSSYIYFFLTLYRGKTKMVFQNTCMMRRFFCTKMSKDLNWMNERISHSSSNLSNWPIWCNIPSMYCFFFKSG